MWWQRRRRDPADNGARGPLTDWVVVPFRILEPARVSLYTIGSHPDMPLHIQRWIAEWLHNYNTALSSYFRENYGPDIFPTLDAITDQVRSATYSPEEDSFTRWEEEFDGESPGDPSAAG